jgi:hypothetical protein
VLNLGHTFSLRFIPYDPCSKTYNMQSSGVNKSTVLHDSPIYYRSKLEGVR